MRTFANLAADAGSLSEIIAVLARELERLHAEEGGTAVVGSLTRKEKAAASPFSRRRLRLGFSFPFILTLSVDKAFQLYGVYRWPFRGSR